MLSGRMEVKSQSFKEKRLFKLSDTRGSSILCCDQFPLHSGLCGCFPMQHVGDAVPISRGASVGLHLPLAQQVGTLSIKCVQKSSVVGLLLSAFHGALIMTLV